MKVYEVTVTDRVAHGVPEGDLMLSRPMHWSKAKPEPMRCRLSEQRALGLTQDGWKVVEVPD